PPRARRRPDEMNITALTDFGEVRVLRQKSVTRMNRIDIAYFSGAHDAIDFQITFRARWGANANRFIRQLDVERINIRFRVDREGANAKFSTSANDAQCNLAAIRDKDFFKHVLRQARRLPIPSPRRASLPYNKRN